jgi:hypothetical protein
MVKFIQEMSFTAGHYNAGLSHEKSKEFKQKSDDLVEELKAYLYPITQGEESCK